jgi:DNA-binding beta-propeller fold protein YncE
MRILLTLLFIAILAIPSFAQLTFNRIGGSTNLAGAEIVAFDPGNNQLFVTSSSGLQVFNFIDPANPALTTTLIPGDDGANANSVTSVAIANGIVAVSVPDATETNPGLVLFYDAASLNFLGSEQVGALPDMLTFTPDGQKVLVANEGQPSGGTDPDGTVSIIDISGGVGSATVSTVALGAAPLVGDVRIFPAKTQAEDLEPEYITVSADGSTAYVALQENNAMAIIDLNTEMATAIVSLG